MNREGPRVMVIDDCPVTTELIEMMLAKDGIECRLCNDPREAMESAHEFQPTVFLLDLRMPYIDGLTLMGQLREQESLASVPVVLLSSEDRPEEKAKAFEAGANDYLVKTPQKVELCARVRYHSRAYRNSTAQLAKTNRELEALTKKALQASEAKSTFLTNMSHEIRTPMNGVLGLTSLLLETNLDKHQRDLAENILDSGKSLLRIINDILDTGKIESGKLDIQKVPFELPVLLERISANLHPLCREKGVNFGLRTEPLPQVIIGDPGRLRQVLMNLLSNAIRFTEQGSVDLKVGRDENTLRFSVSDTGIGIPPEALAAIFEPFTQADSSTSRLFGGTGLGLTIASSLIRLMEGELKVDSQVGVGTTFTFTLPFETGELPEPEVEAKGQSTRSLEILLAEDNPLNQVVSCGFLEMLGHHVQLANNGAEALELYESAQFDLILLDLEMPEVDGWTAYHAIREAGGTLPVVALTAHALDGIEEKCRQVGMDGYLSKPFLLDELEAVIREVMPGV